jgi:predicted DNA-binding antitoxin AbrB/MazE fold protein
MKRNTIDAIFENGVFRPSEPVNIPEGERVSLVVKPRDGNSQDFSEVSDLLDTEFVESCQARSEIVPSVDDIRGMLKKITESLAERIASERDER